MPWKVIEFQDPTGEIIVARVPPEGTGEFVSGTQLIVQDGQIAAFFHDGKPTDGFRAGRFNLTTQNVPVLSKVLKLVSLSPSPFRSYVYFIALKTFTDLGWGTPTPILFRDREFRMVNLRGHGTFAVRIVDPRAFLNTIVGTQGKETTFAVQEYLRKIIASRLAEILPQMLTTVLDLPQHYSEIAVRMKKAVHDDFDQYGLDLVDLLIEAVTVPEEVQSIINRAAGSRAISMDEVNRYQRVAQADALRDAAKQPGEGASGLAAGLGVGAGLSMAREMAGQSAPSTAVPGTRATIEEIKTRLKELKGLVEDGLITQEDFEAQKKRLLDQL